MSKTLFWYLLKDLVRIFLLASGTLAGIMSFGALLKPLMQHGLDASQVGKILSYFSPAMTTYSFPVAALFATTIVYGRLSADNELTACRATGISNLSMTMPAMVLGLSVGLISLLFLSFIVPNFTLKVEKVIYSNIARLVANKITRTHEISYGKTTIFARGAQVLPPDSDRPGAHRVALDAPTIYNYTRTEPDDPNEPKLLVPSQIWTAQSAVAYITQTDEKVELEAVLKGGTRFPRGVGGTQFTIDEAQFGPAPIGSPIRENAKFMDIRRLKHIHTYPHESRRLKTLVVQFVREEQRTAYFEDIAQGLRGPTRTFRFASESEAVVVSGADLDIRIRGPELVINPRSDPENQRVRVTMEKDGAAQFYDEARQVRITLDWPDPATAPKDFDLNRVIVGVEGFDVVVQADDDPTPRLQFRRPINIPMEADLREIGTHDVRYYLSSTASTRADRDAFRHEYNKVMGSIYSEMHGRASFAVSCFILVMVGCALGMISKSGNFLSAFAVSVVPALLCIALIVTGQHICENRPKQMSLGLSLIWSGNVVVSGLAVILLAKLQRQ